MTPLLKRRIDKAIEAFRASPNPNVKTDCKWWSKGGDEKISEAQAICNYILEETDVSMESILLETSPERPMRIYCFQKKWENNLLKILVSSCY